MGWLCEGSVGHSRQGRSERSRLETLIDDTTTATETVETMCCRQAVEGDSTTTRACTRRTHGSERERVQKAHDSATTPRNIYTPCPPAHHTRSESPHPMLFPIPASSRTDGIPSLGDIDDDDDGEAICASLVLQGRIDTARVRREEKKNYELRLQPQRLASSSESHRNEKGRIRTTGMIAYFAVVDWI